jgi:hypothetical protein
MVALNAESAALFATYGPTSSPPRSWMFKRSPSAAEWQAQLAGQTRLTVTAAEALEARAHCVGISGRRGLVVGQRSRRTTSRGGLTTKIRGGLTTKIRGA